MHIARIGRGSWRVRAGIALLYLVLSAGAVTTLYPFLLMVSTGAKSQTDYADYSPGGLIPRYLHDERLLYQKYLEDRYANNLDDLTAAHGADYPRLIDATPQPVSAAQQALVDDWNALVRSLPPLVKTAAFGPHENAPSPLLLRFRAWLRPRFGDDIARLNTAWTEENVRFDAVTPPFERVAARAWSPDLSLPKVRDWMAFKATLPDHFLSVTTADPLYQRFLKEDVYEDDLKRLNGVWGTAYRAWNEITLPRTAPKDASVRDWERFVRTHYPLRLLAVDPGPANAAWKTRFPGTPLPVTLPASGAALTRFMDFIARDCPLSALHADSPENLWRAHLAQRFGTVDTANTAFGTSWRTLSDAHAPQALADAAYVHTHATTLRVDFATRNFRSVAEYILLHGRAVGNTVLFCALAILGALIVNPLCAYALSRYPLPYAYKVLVFLLATMAFPAEVAMIPNFLLLKQLGMLNTFWALILPGLASGYSIFLLKGFFDSLPRELYEAGILDGATELTMFRRITLPLSLPIFSVIALNAFTASYGAFLFALVVCQDQRMWTLMVWLYNLQADAPQYVIMAALSLAALPTLVVFLFAQRVILRGIVLPSFK
jgi:multiple sugar transport system permease protein